MDQSFNDQELSDIMKEIEALEEDFITAEEKTASPVMEELANLDVNDSVPVSASSELEEEEERAVESIEPMEAAESMEPVEATVSMETVEAVESMDEVEEIYEEHEVKAQTPFAVQKVVSLESKRTPVEEPVKHSVSSDSKGASTSMNFKIQGNLTLDLQFDIGGKVICLEVTETGLSIEMEGGMKFTVPVSDTSKLKKAV
jgi:hypothetical protein